MQSRNIYLLGLVFILLFGCKGFTDKFTFNASNVKQLTKYDYRYGNGRKTLMVVTTYNIMMGRVIDTAIYNTRYEYNSKGVKVKEIMETLSGKPDICSFSYDSRDSLVSEVDINSNGDTSFIEKYEYFPDGKKVVFYKRLTLKGKDFNEFVANRTYDTISYSRVYVYEGKVCKSMKEYDQKKGLLKSVEYEYVDNTVSKETYYSWINGTKMFIKTCYYDYSKNKTDPEFYTTDLNNNIFEFKKYELKGNEIACSIQSYEFGDITITEFYKNGRVIGEIDFNKYMNYRKLISTEYYENGDIKEEKSYSEKAK